MHMNILILHATSDELRGIERLRRQLSTSSPYIHNWPEAMGNGDATT